MTVMVVLWKDKIISLLLDRSSEGNPSVDRKVGAVPVGLDLPLPATLREEVVSGQTGGSTDAPSSYWGRQAGGELYVAPVPRAEATVTALGPRGPEARRCRVFLN